MPKDTKTLGNNKARACESRGFVHKKGCARVLTQPREINVPQGWNNDIASSWSLIYRTSLQNNL